MSAIGKLGKFTAGGITGALVGAGAALLFAPDSGPGFQRGLRNRIDTAKSAGIQAQADKEAELVQKFRTGVSDPVALKSVEEKITVDRLRAITPS
jgi:gas vesicle protein